MQPITLFPDQEKFVNQIRPALIKHKRIIPVAATGYGKTKTFLCITRMAIGKGNTVLIITESRKIFSQIAREQHGRLIANGTDHLSIRKGEVYIAMAQTLIRRPRMIENFAYFKSNLVVINDEAHIGNATKILRALPDAYLLGFTATPDARTAKHIPELYNHLVIGPQPQELIELGRLVPYRHYARVGMDADILEIQNGEYTEASQERAFETKVIYDGLIEDLRTLSYTKAGIYCASCKHADDVHAELTENGFDCVKYYNGIPDSELKKFTGTYDEKTNTWSGSSVHICVSVGTLTKGWDFQPLDLIAILRKTKSLPLFCQIIGRGSRLSPSTNKTHFTVLDYGENFKEHGLWNMDRDWDALAQPPKKTKKLDVAPVKSCPDCQSIVTMSTRQCPYCGYVWPKPEQPEESPESKLVEVTGRYEQMKGKRVSSLTPEELAIYAKLKNKRNYAVRIAKSQEQRIDGWMRTFAKHMGYKDSWYWMNCPKPEEPEIQFADIVIS